MLSHSQHLPTVDAPIDLWQIRVADCDDELRAGLRTCLDAAEGERFDRYRVPAAQMDFLVGRAGLRLLLAERFGLPPLDLRLLADAHGKPQLPEQPGWHCNYSHSAGQVLIALARAPVGVDIQAWRRVKDQRAMARRYFSPTEFTAWQTATDRDRAFFRAWTRKEAVSKADGRGLALGMPSFTVDLGDDTPLRVCSEVHPELALLRLWDLPQAHGFSAAVAGNGLCTGIEALDAETLAGLLGSA